MADPPPASEQLPLPDPPSATSPPSPDELAHAQLDPNGEMVPQAGAEQIEARPVEPGPPAELEPVEPDPAQGPLSHPTRRTRVSGTWVGVIIAALVLTLLLVFILQNTKSVKVSYFTATWTVPLGVVLLLATIGGVLFAGVIASMRIWQLRRRLGESGQSADRGRRARRSAERPRAVQP
jgi:uncharacterized integral membrane protein